MAIVYGNGEMKRVRDIELVVNVPEFAYSFSFCELQAIVRNMQGDVFYRPMLQRMTREDGNDTSVGRGHCPFPLQCSHYADCMKYACNFDEINGDYAFRRS